MTAVEATENIYQAPEAELDKGAGIPQQEQKKLLSIARRQKYLLYTWLFYFIVMLSMRAIDQDTRIIGQLLASGIFLAMWGLTIGLCWHVYGVWGRIITIPLGILPGINFFVMLAASSRANKLFKAAGIKVGLMGVRIKAVQALNTQAE